MLEFLQVAVLRSARQLWLSLPLFVAMAATIAMTTPLKLTPFPAPDIALIAVFFWAVAGPAFLPAPAVLLLGLTQDFASGAPPGFYALVYLFVYGLTLSQRAFFGGRTGSGALIGFAIVALLTAGVIWLLGSMIYMRWLPVGQIWMQAIVSIVFYWPVSKVFGLMRGTLTKREAL